MFLLNNKPFFHRHLSDPGSLHSRKSSSRSGHSDPAQSSQRRQAPGNLLNQAILLPCSRVRPRGQVNLGRFGRKWTLSWRSSRWHYEAGGLCDDVHSLSRNPSPRPEAGQHSLGRELEPLLHHRFRPQQLLASWQIDDNSLRNLRVRCPRTFQQGQSVWSR